MKRSMFLTLCLVLTAMVANLPAQQPEAPPQAPPAAKQAAPSAGRQIYDRIYGIVRHNFYEQSKVVNAEFANKELSIADEMDPETAVKKARELLKTLDDEYSLLVVGSDVAKEEEAISSSEVGKLGLQIAGRKDGKAETDADGNPKIRSVAPGSPAEKAGLKAGDGVVSIDGTIVKNWDFQKIHNKLLGVKDSEVTLEIARESKEFEITLKRRAFREVHVFGFIDRKNSIGLIRVSDFRSATTQLQLTRVMNKMSSAGVKKGFIVDLRRNPGGQVDVAIGMISRFLPEGKVVTLHQRVGDNAYEDQVFTLTTDSLTKVIRDSRQTKPVFENESDRLPNLSGDIPVRVLVDEFSMSAAELFAGAIKDNGRGKLIGKKTFGKGIGQSLMPIVRKFQKLPDITLHISNFKFLTPSGAWIGNGKGDGKGGIPVDIEVTAVPGKDAQYIAAVEDLGGTIEDPEKIELEPLNANKSGFVFDDGQ